MLRPYARILFVRSRRSAANELPIGPFGRHGRWDRQHLSKNRKSDFKPVHRVCWHIDQVVGPLAAGKPRDGDPPLAFGDVDKPRCRMAAHCFGPPPSGARILGN